MNSATISLTDDDGVPTSITLTVDDDDVGEGDGAATITVTASANGATGFTQPQTVRVSVGGERHGAGGGLRAGCRTSTSCSLPGH